MQTSQEPKKLWGGRFSSALHRDVESYTFSLESDIRLLRADIIGSIAHVEMLGRQKVIAIDESVRLAQALKLILAEVEAGESEIPATAEDIHSAIELLLGQKVGNLAGKLHTARSRNDQVATACRIYLREETDALKVEIASLQRHLVSEAKKHLHTLLPGTTHQQHGQPISLAHHLMAYFWMFERDRARLSDFRKRLNQMPLGSGALAGTSLPIERVSVSEALGFEGLCENSLDAVSDRDFVVEFLSATALLGIHLSRLSEELILWSTPEYGFVELADEVTTGSSLMPQKKNPDVAELIRGRTGRLTGALVGTLTLLKGLPLSYNRDLQEDKIHLFAGIDTARASVRLMKLLLEKATWKTARMQAACEKDYSNATDLADYLVKKGVPFRETHEIAGRAVRLAIQKDVALEKLPLADLKGLHAFFEADIFAEIDNRSVMEKRKSRGGTAPEAVMQQIELAERCLS